jgi:hypothetical protein
LGFEPWSVLDVPDVVDEVSVGVAAGWSVLGALTLGVLGAVASALGLAVSVLGLVVSVLALGVAVLVEAELSGTLTVSVDVLVSDGVEAAPRVGRIFGVDLAALGAFFGAGVASSTVAICGVATGVDGVAAAGVLESATSAEAFPVSAVVLA